MSPLERQMIPCSLCEGTGKVWMDFEMPNATEPETCPKCDGLKNILESHEAYEARLVGICRCLFKLPYPSAL